MNSNGRPAAPEPLRQPMAAALATAVAALPDEPLLAVLGGSDPATTHRWESACALAGVRCDRIDLTRADWLERIRGRPYDCLLVRPQSALSLIKQLFDERISVLDSLGLSLYPTRLELELYENKRLLSYWLRAHGVPHPATYVFYQREEALTHLAQCPLPVVGKSNIGAAGSGVDVLRTRSEAERYVRAAFSRQGLRRRFGPNLKQGALAARGSRLLRTPTKLLRKLKGYLAVHGDVQRGYVLLQDYVPHAFEWRAVKIGDSYFAHKKMVHQGMASGSKLKDYGAPPLALLDFVRELCERHRLTSQAVDLFETPQGGYLVNELQTSFGQSDPHQMLIDGVPGRYRYGRGVWVFEPGAFNTNESFDLRLLDVLERLAARHEPVEVV
jgi:hypothetical protein